MNDEDIKNSLVMNLPRWRRSYTMVYLVLIFLVCLAIAALPFLYTTISIRTQGIIRPQTERTEIKTAITGLIDTICYQEGALVKKGALLVRLKDLVSKSRIRLNEKEMLHREQCIADLQVLTTAENFGEDVLLRLITPVYKDQAIRFIHQLKEQQATLKKVNRELEMSEVLAKEKVISPKEFFDTRIQVEKTAASYQAFKEEQRSQWEAELSRDKLELLQYQDRVNQIGSDAAYYEIRSPVTGIVQGINNRYAGTWIMTNESICSISPEDKLIGECLVSTRDIGLLRISQPVSFQIDAFDYNYFGMVTGKLIAMDDDYMVIDNKPLFRVRCCFDEDLLHATHGLTGKLKKGLSFQARFILGKRSLWQLIFDKADAWFNPAAPG